MLKRVLAVFCLAFALVACDLGFGFGDDGEIVGPSDLLTGPGCETDSPWTGPSFSHNRFHCSLACTHRGIGDHAEADWTCRELDALTRATGYRVNEVCFAACPKDSYDYAERPD